MVAMYLFFPGFNRGKSLAILNWVGSRPDERDSLNRIETVEEILSATIFSSDGVISSGPGALVGTKSFSNRLTVPAVTGLNSVSESSFAGPQGIWPVREWSVKSDWKWAARSVTLAEIGRSWRCRPVTWLMADQSCRGDFRYWLKQFWKYSFFSFRYKLLV